MKIPSEHYAARKAYSEQYPTDHFRDPSFFRERIWLSDQQDLQWGFSSSYSARDLLSSTQRHIHQRDRDAQCQARARGILLGVRSGEEVLCSRSISAAERRRASEGLSEEI